MRKALLNKSASAWALAFALVALPVMTQAQEERPGQRNEPREERGGGAPQREAPRAPPAQPAQPAPAPRSERPVERAAPPAQPSAPRPSAVERRDERPTIREERRQVAPVQQRERATAPVQQREQRVITRERETAPRATIRRNERRDYTVPRYEQREVTRTRPSVRYRERDRTRAEPGFVFLGGPRIIVRSYGYGWCRGLHRGRHWAPRIGWHTATHRGLFRCRW